MNVIAKLSVHFQQKAFEESKDLADLSRDQEGILDQKRRLRGLRQLLHERVTSDNSISDADYEELSRVAKALEVSTKGNLDELKKIIDANAGGIDPETGEAYGAHAWIKDTAEDKTFKDEREKLIQAFEQEIDSAMEDRKDSDDQVSFRIQYHWGNYSNYVETASSLEKREDDHNRAIIGNLG